MSHEILSDLISNGATDRELIQATRQYEKATERADVGYYELSDNEEVNFHYGERSSANWFQVYG